MAEMEEVVILKVGTDEAVKSVADLRENISLYKQALSEVEIGTQDYQNILKELQINQAALKNAMHATAGTMQDVVRDATAMNVQFDEQNKLIIDETTSYNALVKKMAELDQQFRSTTDAGERAKLGQQINSVNDALKKFDEDRGKFGRNVGNYKSALDGLSTGFTATAGAAKSVINPLKNMTTGLQALSATPALAVLGLMANALTKVGEGIKSDEENTNSWNRALAAFKPISDAFTRSMQSIGAAAADLANKFVELLYQWGLLDEEAGRHRQQMADDNAYLRQLQRGINLENANLEETISDLRAKAAQRDKYTAQERLTMLEEATKWQMKIEENNSKMLEERLRLAKEEAALARNDAATNDKINELEVAVIEQRVKRNTTLRRLNREMSSAKAEIARADAKAAKDTIAAEDEVTENTIASVDEIEKALARLDKALDDYRSYWNGVAQETAAMLADANEELTASIQEELDAQLDAEFDAMMREREIMRQRIDVFQQFSGAVASIAGTIADIYEQDADASAEAARKAKGFKTAEAIISTLSGAVAAYVSTWTSELPLSVKSILAPVNAAAVLAAGYAQVRKIQSTSVTGTASPVAATVAAPAVTIPMQQVRTITGASEEVRLNQMASPQRVYILASDLQAERNASRVQLAETSF